MTGRQRTVLGLGMALAASLGIPAWLGGSQVFLHIGRTAPWALVGAPVLMFLAWCVNGLRVRYLLAINRHSISYARAWLIAAGGDFGGALGPGLLTGIGAYVLLTTRAGLASFTAVALFTLEKLLDLSVFFATLVVSITLLAWLAPGHVPWYIPITAVALSTVLLTAIGLGAGCARTILRGSAGLMGHVGVSGKFRRRWLRWGLGFRRDVRRVMAQPPHRLAVLLTLAAGYWSCRFAILPLLAAGLGLSVPWPYLVLVQVLAVFAGQLSVLPGGAVSVEVLFALLLAPWIEREMLGTLLLLWRASVFYLTLVGGGVAFAGALGRVR
ncbi:lysylphosphatidylglycerol synthase transmembrane domain-containing protein [Acidihalobacter ferrooxydans]|uniref:TIGR00374 family protein n=1 Tax=Acidihalobacter ferrooxydans TaxID=1765967 RepID=A0A1P8UGH4_9GAMM|nr:lysylphosphatidylglycerol synthase transmembrane domain-containing protein [Acidihalobacter ferrooxydans]APZ42942.1 hypothetical protein BW247_07425 [Acidihalobacter ferrooxydans]